MNTIKNLDKIRDNFISDIDKIIDFISTEYNLNKKDLNQKIYKKFFNKQNLNLENKFDLRGFSQIIIENELYYIDENFIYIKQNDGSLLKVGYKEENEYVFTSNPFELNLI